MALALALAAYCLCQGDTPDGQRKLIEQLKSDSAEERADAAKKLVDLGDQAIPALQEAERNKDRSVALNAKDILKSIAAKARVKEFRPECVRLSITFSEKPFAEALTAITRPYGLTSPGFNDSLASRTVCFSIEQGSFWEAVAAFCEANQCTLSNLDPNHYQGNDGNQLWIGPKPAKPFPYLQWRDIDDCRVILDSTSAGGTDTPGLWKSNFRILVALPPGAWVEAAALEDIRIRDHRDFPIKVEATNERIRSSFDCKRRAGVPTRVVAGTFSIIPSIVNPAEHLTIEGKLRLFVPDAIETIPSTPLPGGAGFSIPGAAIAVRKTQGGVLTCIASGTTGDEGLAFQIAAFGVDGKRLLDLGPFRIPPSHWL